MTKIGNFGRRLRFVLVAVAVAYLGAGSYLYFAQRSFVFKPGGTLASPEDNGLAGIEVVKLKAADGTRLRAWYAKPGNGKATLLYFHGNAGNVSGRSSRFRMIVDAGYGLLAPSYRGYPGSSGTPSEASFISDGVAAFDWLDERSNRIIVYGESLGSAVATAVAAEREADALVLEAPFSAAVDLAGAQYPWLPVSLLMKDPFRSRDRIDRVSEPLLIIQGTADRIVPIEQGRDLYSRANQPKRMHVIEGGGHGDLWDRDLWPTVDAFVQSVEAEKRP